MRRTYFILLLLFSVMGCDKITQQFNIPDLSQENEQNNRTQEHDKKAPEAKAKSTAKIAVTGIINKNSVLLRSAPSLRADVLGALNKGTELIIMSCTKHTQQIRDRNECWYEVKQDDGRHGWVYGFFVTIADERKRRILIHTALDAESRVELMLNAYLGEYYLNECSSVT
jgi:uncharacterized protein YgiM (DUF1202 family)